MSSTGTRPRTRGDRTHRTVLMLIGVLLLAGGLAAVLAGAGLFGTRFSNDAVFDNPVGRYAGAHGDWLWPVAALVSILVGLLALRWLLTLAHTPKVGELDLSTPAEASNGMTGRTYLESSAVLAAVNTEIEGYRGVVKSAGQLQGDARNPRLHLQVDLVDDVDVLKVRQRIEGEAVAHARSALDRSEMNVTLHLRVTTKSLTRSMR